MTAVLIDEMCREHLVGRDHPERPERFDAVVEGITAAGLTARAKPVPARAATEDEVALCHTRDYIRIVRHDVAANSIFLSTGDTEIGPNSFEVALRAAGGVLNAVDLVMTGEAANAFCPVRPPGHHAAPSRGMGFCIFNNVAIAARYAQKKYGVSRVLVLDWDVHHGNGTQDAFYSDPSVFVFNTHQWPLYPGTGRAEESGAGAGKGTTMNFPFPALSGRKEILGAVTDSLIPAMRHYRPELVLISSGFDSRAGDPLGGFTLTDGDFADLTRVAMSIASEHARGRIVSVLEGGYSLAGLAAASAAHVAVLMEA